MSEDQALIAGKGNLASFDPHAYTIVVRRVVLDGEPVFHGRVMELPDLEAFEPTHEGAYNFLVEGIRESKSAFDEQGRDFPAPLPDESPEFSGRVTIRMPTWLHAQLNYGAQIQQTSLNLYMVTLLSWAASAAPMSVSQDSQSLPVALWDTGVSSLCYGPALGKSITISGSREGVDFIGWTASSAVQPDVQGALFALGNIQMFVDSPTPRVTSGAAGQIYGTTHRYVRVRSGARSAQSRIGKRAAK